VCIRGKRYRTNFQFRSRFHAGMRFGISQHTGSVQTPHPEPETGNSVAKLCKGVHTTRTMALEKCGTFNIQDIICPGKSVL
jgi:hypothetical protein